MYQGNVQSVILYMGINNIYVLFLHCLVLLFEIAVLLGSFVLLCNYQEHSLNQVMDNPYDHEVHHLWVTLPQEQLRELSIQPL